jgi:DNA polymerase-1
MSDSKPNKLFLIDGHALAYRSHFAFINANLTNSEGIPTGPLLGFANTIVKLLETEEPSHVAVAWDTSAPTFRHEMDENYKANRPPQPEELRQTIPLMKEMVEYLGFKNLQQDGYEADDIIGTLATYAGKEGTKVIMVTPDKDFMQLVTENVHMFKPSTKGDGFQVLDPEGVEEFFGVPPEKVVDVLAIIGDTSDNIPGVPGIGKKGAPKLIQDHGSLEAAIEAAPGMKAKRAREGLSQNKEQALLSKKMIIINTDVPDTATWDTLKWDGPQSEKLVNFFERMEFNTLRRKFNNALSLPKAEHKNGQGDLFGSGHEAQQQNGENDSRSYVAEKVNYQLVKSEKELKKLVKALKKAKAVCFDTETTGTDALTAELVGLALALKAGEAWYVSVDESGENGLPLESLQTQLSEVMAGNSLKIAHNYKYDYSVLRRHGIEVGGPIFDTMIAAYLIDSNQRLSMDELSRQYLNYSPISITELIGKGKKQKSMRDIPVDEVYPYACEDADITLQLYELLHKKLEEDALLEVAENLEFPLIPVLARMELSGVKLDTEMLAGFSQQLGEDMLAVQKKIYETAGEEFNINSPAQLSQILFEKLELPAGKKTKSGNYSTGEQILSELAHNYEIASLVLDYRSLSKLKSTYVDALPKLINEETGRVHTNFNQQIAATGRLSSSNPNLQNIPIRTERGREIRKAFIAEEGYSLVAVDYSQIELRVIASISEDEAMMQAFKNDEDIHARTAREIFGLESNEDVDREMRRKAKEVNFGIPYGVSAFGLAQRLGIDRTEAKTIIDAYFERFPGIRRYINETTEFAREHGYVTTLMKRRRYIPEIRSNNPNRRGFAERTAINMPIQGTAAELIKVAMLRLQPLLDEYNAGQQTGKTTRMVLQVHDELLFEMPDDQIDELLPKINEVMEQAMTLKVPVKVEAGVAKNWLQAH